MTRVRPTEVMQVILDRLAREDGHLPDPTTLPPAQGRAQAAEGNRRWNRDLPQMARVADFDLPGGAGQPVACRLLVPEGAEPGVILFLHGGGWAFLNMDTHERAARLQAIASGVAVLLCDYRLAPEHPFPAGLQDCIAVWRALRAGTGPLADLTGPLAISGDSAGANLALAVMLAESGAGQALPDMALLFYGCFGVDFISPSYVDCAEGPGLTRGKMQRYWAWYLGDWDPQDPEAVPLCASDAALAALPPLYLNAAEVDPLRSDSERLYARLTGLGRKDQFRLYGGVVHGFMQMSLELEEARRALADAGAAFRARFGRAAR